MQDRLNTEKRIQMHQANTTSAQTLTKEIPKKPEHDQGHGARELGKEQIKGSKRQDQPQREV